MALRIKELMDEKSMKSIQLSEMIGISKVSISNLLNGKLKPSFDTLEKIATALDVPMWQLFASPDEVNPPKDITTLSCPHCGKDIEIRIK